MDALHEDTLKIPFQHALGSNQYTRLCVDRLVVHCLPVISCVGKVQLSSR